MTGEGFPQDRARDHARRIVEAIVSEFPGGSVAVGIGRAASPGRLERAREEFIAQAAEQILALGVAFDADAEGRFAGAAVQAWPLVQLAHSDARIGELARAATAFATASTLAAQHRADRLFSLVVEVTDLEFIVLRFAVDPSGFFLRSGASIPNVEAIEWRVNSRSVGTVVPEAEVMTCAPSQLLFDAFPDWVTDAAQFEDASAHLVTLGLLDRLYNSAVPWHVVLQPFATPLGRDLVDFVGHDRP